MSLLKDKGVKQFANYLLSNYSEFSTVNGHVRYDMEWIPDHDLEEFASIMMRASVNEMLNILDKDEILNCSLQKALMNYMADTTDKDNEMFFLSIFKKRLVNHFKPRMIEALDSQLQECENTYRFMSETREYRI